MDRLSRLRVLPQLALFVFSLFLVSSVHATILYVRADSTGGDGTSWANAYNSLSAAIAAANPTSSNPVEIWIAKGTYKPGSGSDRTAAFRLKSHLIIRGGFRGDETVAQPRQPWGNPTVLSGDIGTPMIGAITDLNPYPTQLSSKEDAGWADNCYNVLVGDGVENVILEYVTVTGGSATDASIASVDIDGYETYAANPATSGAKSAVKPSSTVVGGGLYFTTGETWTVSKYGVQLLGCRFVRNRARAFGGGVGLYDASAWIDACQFEENVSDGSGGAFWGSNQQSGFVQTNFTDNTSKTGGGAVSIKSIPSFRSSDSSFDKIFNGIQTVAFAAAGAQQAVQETQEDAKNRISKALSDYAIFKSAQNYSSVGGGAGLYQSIAQQLINETGVTKDDVKLVLKTVNKVKDIKDKAVEIKNLGGLTSLKTRPNNIYAVVKLSVEIGDIVAEIFDSYGLADHNNPHYQNWKTFSYNFNKYATAEGLFKLWFEDRYAGVDMVTPNIMAVKKNALRNYYTQAGRSGFAGCVFSGNETESVGGAIELVFNNLLVESCTFTDNRAVTDGAAIASSIYSMPQVVSSLFSNNFSDQGTSAIANSSSSLMMVSNCTIINNTSFDKEGVALSAAMGADVRVYNSILWGNVNATKSKGADVLAITRDMLDEDARAKYDALQGGQQANWVGIMDIRNSIIQSLKSIPLGTDKLSLSLAGTNISQAEIDAAIAGRNEADARGELEGVGAVNAGSGVRPKLRDASYGNSDADPLLLAKPLGKPSRRSPVHNAGDDRWATGRLIEHATVLADILDVSGKKRILNSKIDIGAYEIDPLTPDEYPQLASQAVGADSDAPVATGVGAGTPPTISSAAPAGTTIYYVKPVASGTGSGSSWANATADLKGAINHADAEVWVAAGTYTPGSLTTDSFAMANGVKIFGGFAGTEALRSQRNWRTNVTIISGDIGTPGELTDNSRNLFKNVNVASSAVLDGFTLQYAYSLTTDGGAILNTNSDPLIQNCVFRNNHAANGGAIYSTGTNAAGSVLINCEFRDNSADSAGGAIRYTNALFGHSLIFSGNTAGAGGGALSVTGSLTSRYCTIQNGLFYGNSSTAAAGGAIASRGLYLNVQNSTFYANSSAISTSQKSGGGAIDHAFPTAPRTASAVILNSIFYKNTAANNSTGGVETMEKRQVQTPDPLLLSYCLVQGLNTYAGGVGQGNFDGDPQFVAEGSDFHLQERSLAIDAGDSSDVYTESLTVDLEGNKRPFRFAIDLGPYEKTVATPAHPVTRVTQTTAAGAEGATGGGSHTFTSNYASVPGDTVRWYVDRGDGLGFVALEEDSEENVGVRTDTLTVLSRPNGFTYRLQVIRGGVTYISPASRLLPTANSLYVFVKPVPTGDGNGTSWADATDLQSALNKGDGFELWLAEGTYRPTSVADRNAYFSATKSQKIYGGFAVNQMVLSKRDWRAHKTIISGEIGGPGATDNSKHLLINTNVGNTAVLDGLYFRDAYGDGVDGGAIMNVGSSPLIRNCVFETNYARNGGAISSTGVALDRIGPVLAYCEFNGNRAELGGGAVYYLGSLFTNNLIFKANTAQVGGAVYASEEAEGQSADFENSLFTGNQASSGLGGAVWTAGLGLSLTNCTFYGNQAKINSSSLSSGGAVYFDDPTSSATLQIRNSIFYKNTAQNDGAGGRDTVEKQQIFLTVGSHASVRNTLIQGLDVYALGAANTNLDADPLFVAEGIDFHVTSGSLTIDSGANPTNPNFEMTDLDGGDRVVNNAIDLGAYEHAAVAANPLRTVTAGSAGLENYTFTAQYTTLAGDALQWYVDRGDGNGFVVLGLRDPGNDNLPQEYFGVNSASLTILSPPSGYRFQLRLVRNGTVFFSTVKQLRPTEISKGSYIYVRPMATGDGSGSGWINATSDLQAAMSHTNAEVWVQEGTYRPTSGTDRDKSFSLTTYGVKVYGGFKGSESLRDARNPALNVTRISGAIGGSGREDNSRHLFRNTVDVGGYTILDGLTFEDAYADGEDGGAIHNTNSAPTIRNCVFQNNYARNGGAIFSTGTNSFGSALVNCTFKNNTAELAGGAISYNASLNATSVIFEGNQAASGGALSLTRSFDGQVSTIKNGLFFNNRALSGNGGAVFGKTSFYASNCTFYGNQSQLTSASKLGGGAVYLEDASANVTVNNSIFYGNSSVNGNSAGGLETLERQQIVVRSGGYVSAQNSLIQGLAEYANTAFFANFDEIPEFVNPAAGNFRLSTFSPAVNAGTLPSYPALSETDLDGNARVQSGMVDLGPYENTSPAALGRVTSSSNFTSGVARFIKASNFVVQPNDVLQWYVDRGDGIFVLLSADSVYSGVNTTTLTITAPPSLADGYKFRLQVIRGGDTLTTLSSRLTLPLGRIYVDAARAGMAATGASWATAYGDLQQALKASGPGTEISVASGTYYPTTGSNTGLAFQIPAGVSVYGGYVPGVAIRNLVQNPTILSGQLTGATSRFGYSRNVVRNQEAQGRAAVLDGFILKDSYSSLVLNDGASPTIRNCVFQDNDSTRSDGAALAIANINGANPLIAECQFLRNQSSQGGVLSVSGASATIENSLFAQNNSSYSSTILVEQGTLNMVHCTVADNSTSGNVAGLRATDSTVTVSNSIFWNNKAGYNGFPAYDQAIRTLGGSITFQSSCIQGGTSLPATNIATDPLFAEPTATAEYALAPYSPLVNAGSATYAVSSAKDLAGNPRVYFTQPDMGAYELQRNIVAPISLTSLPRSRTVYGIGGSVDFTVTWPTTTSFSPVWEVWKVVNGQPVTISAARYSILGGTSGTSTLRLNNISLDDSGIKVVVKAFYYDDVLAQNTTLYTPPATLMVRLPRIVRVNPAATGSNNGGSWANAYTDLATALDNAQTADEIWVAKGTYTAVGLGYFQLKSTVSIYGGFSGLGTETTRGERNAAANPTVLHAVANYPVLYGAALESEYGLPSVLDGFIVENSTGPISVYNNVAGTTYLNCIFRNNAGVFIHSQSQVQYDHCEFTGHTGALFAIDRSTVTLSESSIHDNTAQTDLIRSYDASTVTLSDVTATNNVASGAFFRTGGGTGASLTVLRSAFRGNSTGGAVIANGTAGTCVIESSLLAKNIATGDLATVQNSGTLSLTLSTVADNRGGSFGGGLYTYRGAVSAINTCILWGNRGTRATSTIEAQQLGDSTGTDGAGTLTVKRSTIEGLATFTGGVDANTSFYPLFVNSSAGDYHLVSYSPAIDDAASNMPLLSASDLDKVARRNVYGAAGAYEYSGTLGTPLLISTYPASIATAETTATGFTYVGQGSTQWQYYDGASWVNITSNTSDYRVINVSGNPATTTLYFDSPSFALTGTRFRLALTFLGNTYTTGDLVLTVNRPRVIYVNGGLAASGDGSSWAAAYKTVQEALAATNENCDIWVQAGRYSIDTANLKWNVHLYGGFAGTETLRAQRNWTANEVTLFGNGKRIFSNSDPVTLKTSHAVLDGFTLTGSTSSTSVFLTSSDAVISNCTFRGNAGAIGVASHSNPVIANCLFESHSSTVLSLDGDSATVSGCTFQSNTNSSANASGSTVYVYRGSVKISDTKFIGNTSSGGVVVAYGDFDATSGGNVAAGKVTLLTMSRCQMTLNTAYAGILATQVLLTLDNSLIAQNTLTSNAVRGSTGCLFNLTNATIADNTGTFENVAIACDGTLNLKNSILWGNRTSWPYGPFVHPGSLSLVEDSQIKRNSWTVIANSIVEGAYEISGNGNSGYDPLFLDSGALNYQLPAFSPAIDQGTASGIAAGTLDLASQPRIAATLPDIGAYEFTGVAATPVRMSSNLGARTIVVGQGTQYSVKAPAGVAVQWQVKTGATWSNVVAGVNQTLSPDGSVFTLSNLSLPMTGAEYRFVLSGGVSYTSQGAVLTVVSKPLIYVNVNATGTNTGSSWANAYTSLSDAIGAAANPITGGPREIWVAQGTYVFTTNTPVSPGVDIYGGFAGGEATRSARDIVAHPTILTRTAPANQVTGTYVLSDGYPDTAKIGIVIDGFTFTGSCTGVGLQTGPGVVRNCTFANLAGYGVVAVYVTLTVEDCTFSQIASEGVLVAPGSTTTIRRSTLQARLMASGTDLYPANVSIEDAVVQNAGAGNLGATIYVSRYATMDMIRCRVLNNTGTYALSNGGTLRIRDTLIAGNAGGGLFADESITLTNVTVAGNRNTGIWRGQNSRLTLVNSIVAQNTPAQINSVFNLDPTLGISATHTLIQAQTLTGNSDPTNMKWDPLFTNAAAGNYTLTARSPGIDAGSAAAVLSGETDLLGNARVQSTLPDIGAYEAATAANPLYRSTLPTSVATTRGVDGVFSLTGASSYTYTWQYYNGSAWVAITFNSTTGLWEGPAGVPLTITTVNGVSTLTITGPAASSTGLQFRVIINGEGVTSDPLTLTVSEPEIMYVDSTVVASGDGKTWGAAFKTLSEALTGVIQARRIIYVAKGTYKAPANGFEIRQRTEIYGGFPVGGGTFGARNAAVNPVTLSGELGDPGSTADNAASVLNIKGLNAPIAADTVVDGLTVDGGQIGISVTANARPTLRNLILSHNTASGLNVSSSGGRVENCQFLENSNTNSGGGAAVNSSTVTFVGCSFRGNTALSGAGLSIFNGTVRLESVVISGNKSAREGGGIEVKTGAHFLVNSTVVGNYSEGSSGSGGGGGLYVSQGSLAVWNSIVWANRAVQTSPYPEFQLSIEALQMRSESGGFNIQASNIEGRTPAGSSLSIEPLFYSVIDAASAPTTAGDFHLYGGSPGVDMGDNTLIEGSSTDADSLPRAVRTVDMGAYEFQGSAGDPLIIAQQPADLILPLQTGASQFQVVLAGTGFTYQWESSPNGSVFTPVVNGSDFTGAQTATLQLLTTNPSLHGLVFRVKITGSSGGVVRSRAAQLTVYPTQYYVTAAAADDNGDGYTWATAFRTIGTAFTKARVNPTAGVQVWVAAGTYLPSATDTAISFPLKSKVELYGGFTGTETALSQRDYVAHPTFLRGIAGSTAVFASTGTTAIPGVRIDGFAINTAANGLSMGKNVTVTVANCSFSGLGTGIAGDTDTVTVQNCQFTGLTAAGIANHAGTTSVADSAFSGNALGINQTSGGLNLVRSAFRGNGLPTASGGGVKVISVGATIENCLFSGNYSQAGSGLHATNGYVNVQNCTFAGNYAAFAAGLRYTVPSGPGGLQITNSIFWGNNISGEQVQYSQVYYENSYTSDRPFYNNDIQRLPGSYTDVDFLPAKGNISADPQFKAPVAASAVATAAGDYRLTSLSAAVVNKGSNTYLGASTTDLAQAARTFDTTVDLGAYEFQTVLVAITTQPISFTGGVGLETAIFTVASNSVEASYQWQVSTDGGTAWTDLVASATESGVTTATLTVVGSAAYDGRLYRAKVTSPETSVHPGVAFSNSAQYRYATVVVTPPSGVRNAMLTGASSTISFTVAGGPLPASIVDGSFAVHAMQTGRLSFAEGSLTGLTITGATVSMQSTVPFKPGELVEVSTTSAVQRVDNYYALPLVYQFRAGNLSNYGVFPAASVISGAPATARAMASGDLNGNGSIDLVVGGTNGAAVWLNSGTGTFTATGQILGSGTVSQVLLGSLGMTGSTGSHNKLDLVLLKSTGDIEIWRNEGSGSFTNASVITGVAATSLGLADLNGDGALDLFIATAGADQVWFNNGAGVFSDSTQRLGTGAGLSVAFGDYNNDNTLDVFTANGSGDIEIWENGGAGYLRAGPSPSNSAVNRVIAADLDRDGRLDLVTVRNTGQIRIYRQANNGSYNFTAQFAPVGVSVWDPTALSVGDLDGDGTPDLVFNSSSNAIQVWRGLGYDSGFGIMIFQQITEQPALSMGRAGEFADVNGDGMMDAVFISASGVPTVALYVATPTAPTALIATATSDTQIALTWTDNATTETNYTVERSPNGTNSWTVLSSTLAANTTTYTDTGRSPATAYYYRVRCHVGGILPSAYSTTATVTTFGAINAAADAIAVLEGATATTLVGGASSVLANDSNPDAGTLTAAVVASPAHGSLTLNADGTFSYTPAAAYFGSDSFTYRATNLTTTASATGTVSILVTRLNDAPTSLALTPLAGVRYTGQAAGAAVATLSAVDADPEDVGSLTFSLISGPGSSGNADFTITGTTLKTAVAIDASVGLTRSIRIRVTDSLGLFREDTFTVAFTRAPTASPDSLRTDEDTPLELLLAGAGGASPLNYQIVTSPGHGTLIRSTTVTDANAYLYTPIANFNGTDSFTFRVADSNLSSSTVTVALTVTAVDDAPTLDAIAPVTTVQNTPVSFTLVGRDAEGDTLTSYQIASTPTLGTVQMNGALVTYTPNLNTLGTETLAFTVTAGGKTSAPLQVVVTITPVPVASTVYRGLYEYSDIPAASAGDWSGVLPANISTPAHGSVTLEGSRLRYAHNGDSATSDSFTYTLTNAASDVRTIAVAVTIKDLLLDATNGNDGGAGSIRAAVDTVNRFASETLAPSHTAAAAWTVRIQPGADTFWTLTGSTNYGASLGFYSYFQVLGKMTLDASASPGFILTTGGSHRSRHFLVMTGASLTLKYLNLHNGEASDRSFVGSDAAPIPYGGAVLNFGTFSAQNVVFRYDRAGQGAAVFNYGGTASLTDCLFDQNFILSAGDPGGIVASRNGLLNLTRVNFTGNTGQSGGDLNVFGVGALATVNVSASTIGSFLLTTSSGGSLATTGLPRPANDSATYIIGQPLTLDLATLLANDLGTSAASVVVDTTTAKGVTLTRTGDTLTYQPPGTVTDSDSFTYTVTDAGGLKATATVSLVFRVPSTAPVGNADAAAVYRGLPVTIDVLANDTQPSTDVMTITAVTAPTRGTAVIAASGTRILYTQHDTPANQSATTDTFTYTVSNSGGATANVPVTVTINDRVIHANSGAYNNGAGTIGAALAVIDGYRETTLAPAGTTTPDWTIKIFAFPNETWVAGNDSPNSLSGDLTSYRIHSKVTIDGSASVNFSLQSATYQNNYHVRTFAVDSGASLTLKNLNLVGDFFFPDPFGGFTNTGGAVINSGTFIADHVNFTNHTANLGAALFNEGGTVSLTDCGFSGNSSPYSQWVNLLGIVSSHNGSLSFTRVTFADQSTDANRPELYIASNGTTALSFNATTVPSYKFDGAVTGIASAVNDTVNRPFFSSIAIPVATLLANDAGASLSVIDVQGGSSNEGASLALANGFINYTTRPWITGDDAFTYTVRDSLGFTSTATVVVHMNANTAPTLTAIADRTAFQNAGVQTVNLTGITAGTGETQPLTITATSDNPDLIPDPTVTYASGTTGTLTFTPVSGATGAATITVTVQDDGDGGPNGDGELNYVLSLTRTFTITVTAVNQPPTLDAIDNVALLEDAGPQAVNLAGISAGAGENQALTVTATSSNPALIPNPTVTYTSADSTGSLVYTPVANASGTAIITVTVTDDGGVANSGVNIVTRAFTVTVTAVNDAPTLAAIADPAAILEGAGAQTVNLAGIGAGSGEIQALTVTATSSNTALIPNPTVTYTSANASGSLSYTPVAGARGTAVITVRVQDNGGTANGGIDSVTRTFTVTVTPINRAPTLAAIADPAAILEDAGTQTVNLAGIGAGSGETQVLTVTATSSNTALIPNPTVGYTSANATGSLSFTPVANTSGTALITVKVQDDGGTANGGIDSVTRTFTVTVTAVNDAPTLAAIANPAANLEDAGVQTVNLTGIGAGGGETQALTVTATSSNTALVPNPMVSYTSASATGSLTYTPVANASGTAVITVKVQDDGGTSNGGIDSTTRTFTVTVAAVNDTPTLGAITSPSPVDQDSGEQTVALAGIGAGGGESQTLTVTATSSNPALIPNPAITYVSPQSTGSLRYTPVPGASGTAVITVRVQDDGGTLNNAVDFATRTFTVTVNAVDSTPPALTIAARSGGGVTLHLVGRANTSYAISLSTDLLNWSLFTTVTTDSNGAASVDDATSPAEGAGRFYRAVRN